VTTTSSRVTTFFEVSTFEASTSWAEAEPAIPAEAKVAAASHNFGVTFDELIVLVPLWLMLRGPEIQARPNIAFIPRNSYVRKDYVVRTRQP
jgi:hypothetical protein